MKVLKGVINDITIETIKNVYKNGDSNIPVINKHSQYIDELIKYSEIYYCDVKNVKLLDVLKSILPPTDFKSIYSIHWIKYEEGYECLEHTDMSSYTTYIIHLNDNYIGGDLIVNGKNCESKKGDVVIFNGIKDKHKVTKITKGTREVLVIWINPSVKEKELI